MLKVESFLGCLQLETGGLIIGWLNLVGFVISLLFSIAGIIVMGIFDCGDLRRILDEQNHKEEFPTEIGTDFDKLCGFGRGFLIVVLIISLLVVCGFIAISVLCIKGTENRDHIRVKPMMVLYGVLTVFAFLGILSLSAQGIIMGIIEGCINGYIFVVLYSLFDKFRTEYERGFTVQYQQPGGKV